LASAVASVRCRGSGGWQSQAISPGRPSGRHYLSNGFSQIQEGVRGALWLDFPQQDTKSGKFHGEGPTGSQSQHWKTFLTGLNSFLPFIPHFLFKNKSSDEIKNE